MATQQKLLGHWKTVSPQQLCKRWRKKTELFIVLSPKRVKNKFKADLRWAKFARIRFQREKKWKAKKFWFNICFGLSFHRIESDLVDVFWLQFEFYFLFGLNWIFIWNKLPCTSERMTRMLQHVSFVFFVYSNPFSLICVCISLKFVKYCIDKS